MIEKANLRLTMQQRLALLGPESRREQAARMAERVLALPQVIAAQHVFTCLSFGNEIETRALNDALLESGRKIYLPRTLPRTRQLAVHAYPCKLERRSFGLEEPARSEPRLAADAIDSTIQVALVLGLAFDQCGQRLGYGAGYFDRFLAARPFPAVGLAYDLQLLEQLPREPHDVAMQVVVTDARVLEVAGPEDGTLGS